MAAFRRILNGPACKADILALLCLPILLWQAWRINHYVLRLSEATDEAGLAEAPDITDQPPLRLLVMGESTAAGVGTDSNHHALAGHLARCLSAQLKRPVHWQVIGQNGYRIRDTRKRLCPRVPRDSADIVVLVHGFNDTVGWTAVSRWQNEIARVVERLTTHQRDPRLLLTGIPPFRHFPALPRPTRSILGLRADALEQAADALAARLPRLQHINLDPLPGAEYYCIDGFHPSSLGYRLWAERLCQALAADPV